MKVGYVCTSISKPSGEMRAPPAEKRAAAARASRCAGPCRYTGPGAGCPAPPEPGARIPARPETTHNAKPSGSSRRISTSSPGPGASFVAELCWFGHKC